jgi:hypothetical protein
MRHLLFPLYLFACLALLGCSSPSPEARPDPSHVVLPVVPPMQGTGCPGGGSTWEVDPSVQQLPVMVDLTTCTTAGWTQGQVVTCVQTALDAMIDSACIASGCCLSRGDWTSQLDHGLGTVVVTGGTRKVFWGQLRRKRGGQLDTVWAVAGLGGYADITAATAGVLDAMRPPDCQGGSDGGMCSSLYIQVPSYAPRLGAVDVLIVGYVDARFR